MNLLRRAGAILLAACTAASMASCGENTATAMTVSDYDVRAGIYLYYATSAYGEAVETIRKGDESGEVFKDAETSEDYKKVLASSDIDGVSAEEWIQNKAEEYCKTFAAIEKEFDALGLTLTGEQLASADANAASSMNYYGEFFTSTGIGEETVKDIVLNSYKQDALWEAYYGEGGSKGIEEQQLYDHYKTNTLRTKYIEMPLKDGEGNLLKADGKKEIENMANDYLKRLKKKTGSTAELMNEFDFLIEEHNNYVTSLSEAAVTTTDEEGNTITTPTTAKVTTDKDGNTAATEDPDAATTAAEDEDEETTTAAADEDEDKDEETTTAASDEDEDEGTTTTAADEDEDEETTTTTAADADEEDAEDEDQDTTTAVATTSATGTTETTTTTAVTYSFEYEMTLAVSTSATADDADETTTEPSYTPCEKVYNWVADEKTPLLKPELIKDDECYYIVVKMDIEERMTDDDLWNENQIENVRYNIYHQEFLDMLSNLSKDLSCERNNRAFKRYKVLNIDYMGYQNALMQSYYSMYGGMG